MSGNSWRRKETADGRPRSFGQNKHYPLSTLKTGRRVFFSGLPTGTQQRTFCLSRLTNNIENSFQISGRKPQLNVGESRKSIADRTSSRIGSLLSAFVPRAAFGGRGAKGDRPLPVARLAMCLTEARPSSSFCPEGLAPAIRPFAPTP